MASAPGVAAGHGRIAPEEDGTFLCKDWWEVEWFAEMALSGAHDAVDVWEVSLPDDAEFVETENGYEYHPCPIPRRVIRLVKADWSPTSRFGTDRSFGRGAVVAKRSPKSETTRFPGPSLFELT
jgi:hypothetical protein